MALSQRRRLLVVQRRFQSMAARGQYGVRRRACVECAARQLGAEQPVFVERSNHSAAQRRAIHALSPVRHRCVSAPARRNRGRSVPAGDDWLAQQTGRRLYGRPVCLRLVPLQLWPGAHKQLVIASIRWLPHSIQRRRQHAAARQPRRWPIAGVVAVRLHNERRPARRRPRSRKLQQSVPSRCGADRRQRKRAEQLDHPCALRHLCVRRSAALAIRGRGAGLWHMQHGLPRAW